MNAAHETTVLRPRIEGDRELEILEATLAVLAEVGYDRLTMDAVAARAKASKATLYRRWSGKAALVVEALQHTKGASAMPDTGSLREDLRLVFCGMGGLADGEAVRTFSSVITAISHDQDFADAFRREVLGPKIALSRRIWERARERGEVGSHVDLDLLEPALAGIVLHRVFVLGERPDSDLITRVIDQIIMPAATACGRPDDPSHQPHATEKDPS